MMPPHDDDELDDSVEPTPIWRRRNVRIIAVGAVLVVAFLATRDNTPPKKDPPKSAESFIGMVVPYQPAKAEPPPVIIDPKTAEPPPSAPPPVAKPPTPSPAAPPPPPPAAPDFRRMVPGQAAAAPSVRSPMQSYAVPHTDGPRPGPAQPSEPAQTTLAFKASSLPGIKASPAIDDTYLLMPGLLPCVLDTAINSDLTGALICHLPGPVYSRKGVPLMEAGSQIVGKYESVKNGQRRLMATSTYAFTPNNIWVPLTDNQMSDDLGRNGLPGAVDQHLPERFGAAIALNLLESTLGIIQATASKGGNTYLSFSQGGGIGGLAQQILQSQINIAPTITKNQGEMIAIFLQVPVDFSDSYRIRKTR